MGGIFLAPDTEAGAQIARQYAVHRFARGNRAIYRCRLLMTGNEILDFTLQDHRERLKIACPDTLYNSLVVQAGGDQLPWFRDPAGTLGVVIERVCEAAGFKAMHIRENDARLGALHSVCVFDPSLIEILDCTSID